MDHPAGGVVTPLSLPSPVSNPLLALAAAFVQAALYLLQRVRYLVGWLTVSLPIMVVRVLQYSFTISLGFPHFLALFIGACGLVFVFIRYRYLTKYTQLKEAALPPPSPPTLSNTLPLADAALADPSGRSNKLFHSYLDDFLSAIRIFGYLEKPVFHELSRHLQTRRLAAGDSMDIAGGDFWCVVEGNVQVFAPSDKSTGSSPSPGDFFASDSFNGYHLINEVSTGGTLSSLFSILSLFTEDIKVAWTPPSAEDEGDELNSSVELQVPTTLGPGGIVSGSGGVGGGGGGSGGFGRRSRANSDVSQLDGQTMGSSISIASPLLTARPTDMVRRRSSSMGNETETEHPTPPSRDPTLSPEFVPSGSYSQPATSSPSPMLLPNDSQPPVPRSGTSRSRSRGVPMPLHTSSPRPKAKRLTTAAALKGTIARATMDTTLAVIPAAAFRKLTNKFPKASGTVVQVVLERFSRVTFMTAHKFLGLTREILRSESALNTLVSHPLPRSFYTGGGMQALRDRFQPEMKRFTSPSDLSEKDYFTFEPSPTVKSPSLPSTTPTNGTPAKRFAPMVMTRLESEEALDDDESSPIGVENTFETPKRAQGVPLSPETAVRHSSTFVRRTSAIRKQVAAGDLAMTASSGDAGDAFYRGHGPAQTPAIARNDTWRGKFSSSEALPVPADNPADEGFELREAVVMCIAKSIGLAQPSDGSGGGGYADSLGGRKSYVPSVASTPNSPMFPPNNGRPSRAPPFGNVLDMMNASGSHDNIIGGMIREGLLNRAVDDEMSSVSASVHDSSAAGMGLDVNRNISRDLESNVEILFFPKGSTLVKAGDRSPGIYYVIDGFLDVTIPVKRAGLDAGHGGVQADPGTSSVSNVSERPFGVALGLETGDKEAAVEHLFTVKSGGVTGYLASLCGTDSYVNIIAKTDTFVGFLPVHALQRITERRPIVLLTLAKRLLSLLSPLVLHIDAGLDWMQLGAGQILYEKGDRSSDFYIVINGRLRSLTEKGDNAVEVLREYGQNDSIGELEVITASSRPDTVQAIRDTELVRIPAALFDAISARHPATTVQFMRVIASRVKKAMGEPTSGLGHGHSGGTHDIRADLNLKTVCILGCNRNVPVAQFAAKLKSSLEDIGASTSYLDQATVMRHLGRHAFARIGQLKIAGWLADQEQHYRMVLYVADTAPSSQWTMTCIRQADLVLVLGMGDDPSLGEYEKLMLAMKTFARKELILLHDERAVAPGSTRRWLKNRPWLQAHYHVELPGIVTPPKTAPTVHDPAAVAAFKHLRERVETRIKQYRGLRPLGRPRRPPHMNDFARIARRLCGRQVGLVLGGGGARGISHIGMLQAMEESGVPVDAIGGCSIGSFVGGLYARDTDILETTGRTKSFSARMGSMLRVLSDVTYPFVAYTTGHEFNRGIYKAFYNTHIEDFWIPFFANSTNITHSRMEVHRSGYAWRYVRASMTLAGLLPPLSDNGNMLVDGGYMDNTPIAPLRASGIRDVIVVDVGSIDDTSSRNFGDSVSGWWIFFSRLNPFYERVVPSMTEISSRLTYVSSVKTLEDVKADPNCLYLAMPVQHIETLGGFQKFQEVLNIGLKAARQQIVQWRKEGRLPLAAADESKSATAIKRGNRLRRSSI